MDYSVSPTYRTPPHNIEAEQALLGAILVNNETVGRVSEFLLAEHFFEPLHQRIYEHAVKLIERQQIANPVSLRPFFESDPAMVEIGGPAYLARLAANAVTIINAGDYGRAIYDHAVKRQLIQVGEEIVNTAYEADIDNPAEDQIQTAEDRLAGLHCGRHNDQTLRFAGEMVAAELEAARLRREGGSPSGLPVGFADVDNMLGGIPAGCLVILAGRPSMGKSALASSIARQVASRGTGVAFFSLEMSSDQLAQRVATEMAYAGRGSAGYSDLRRGALDDETLQRLERVAMQNAAMPLLFVTAASPTMTALKNKARQARRMLHRRGAELGLVVVDYLQLIRASDRYRGDKTRETSEVSAALKALAIEFAVPVIALSQLSRQVESREDKRPQLSDLRESGSIEQDADIVMFVFREEYYLRSAEPTDAVKQAAWMDKLAAATNKATLIVAKNRMGPCGSVELFFHPASGAFRSLRP